MESFLNDRISLWSGNCLDVLDGFEENSFDSCVCDPPYHLTSIVKRFGGSTAAPAQHGSDGAFARQSRGFMNTVWDGGDVAFRVETWAKVYRALKPGAFVAAFASSRGFGRMSVAIEDAGFITHPFIAWLFATGFPKATRVNLEGWEGWRYGTQALKPAMEPVYIGQKPFEKGLTGTENVVKWGVGALNIDGCRVGIAGGTSKSASKSASKSVTTSVGSYLNAAAGEPIDAGRWPANLAHDGSEEVIAAFPVVGDSHPPSNEGTIRSNQIYGADDAPRTFHAGFPDAGSAARFFYSAKADGADRLGSRHPTVKPVALLQWLARMVTPPGGTILDCFAGTGTTGEAAFREGFKAVLIEREEEYQADIRRRMALCLAGPEERKRESVKAKFGDLPFEDGTLFADLNQPTNPDTPPPATRSTDLRSLRGRTIGPTGLKW